MRKTKDLSPDVVLKEYWRKPERFADLFNQVLFQGEPVIDPSSLIDDDTDVSGTVREDQGFFTSLARRRDVIKKTSGGMEFALVGIENQRKVHYGMPLRCRLYDDLNYLRQCRSFAPKEHDGRTYDSAEFLSGMKKEDRLNVCITIVLYYGEEPWDGPKCLSDMMRMPEVWKPFFDDYSIRLLEVNDGKKYHFSNEDVRQFFQMLGMFYESRDDKEKREQILETYPDDRPISKDVLMAVAAASGEKDIVECIDRKEEVISMCTLFEALKKEGRQEERQENIAIFAEEMRNMGISDEKICACLTEKFLIPASEARNLLEAGKQQK